jgi:uncharacterized protein
LSAFYFDTSAFAKRYVPETGSKWTRRLLRPSAGHVIVVAELARVEIFSLLNRYRRQAILPPTTINRMQNAFLRHLQSEYLVIPVESAILVEASNLTGRHPLRALDSPQLACALQAQITLGNPVTFISADNNLLGAASAEGFAVDNPNNYP